MFRFFWVFEKVACHIHTKYDSLIEDFNDPLFVSNVQINVTVFHGLNQRKGERESSFLTYYTEFVIIDYSTNILQITLQLKVNFIPFI